MTLKRGKIVGAPDGRAYVVWSTSGEVAHLMPLTAKPRAVHSIRVALPDTMDGAGLVLHVDVVSRRHLPSKSLHQIGALSAEAVAAIAEDLRQQRLEAARGPTRLRGVVSRAAKAAKARREARASHAVA